MHRRVRARRAFFTLSPSTDREEMALPRPCAILVFVFLLLLALPAQAAEKIQEVTSPGGITAWLVEDHSLPVVTLDVTFRGGAALDPADKAGRATLTTDLLDEGAGDLD